MTRKGLVFFAGVMLLGGCGDSYKSEESSAEGSELFGRAPASPATCLKYAKKIMEKMGQKVAKENEAVFNAFVQEKVISDKRQAPIGLAGGRCYTGPNAEDFCKNAIGYTSSGSFADNVKQNCWSLQAGPCDASGVSKTSIHLAAALYRMCVGLIPPKLL